VADIFVSYTSNDCDWAFWIGQELLKELLKLGHVPRIHEWEISGGVADNTAVVLDPLNRRKEAEALRPGRP
jgi:hypothetical protein